MRRPSWYHVTTRSLFLGISLLLGLVLWNLKYLWNLDALRPSITEFLETTYHCNVLVGNVTAQMIPSPGLVIGHVVFLEDAKPTRVLAAVTSIRLSLSLKALLKGRLDFTSIRFLKPRFIVHRTSDASKDIHWFLLELPKPDPEKKRKSAQEWQIRSGSVELWDHTTRPTTKWVVSNVSGTFQVAEQTGAFAGKAARLGPQAVIDLHYNGTAAYPVQAKFNDVELSVFQPLTHTTLFKLEGLSDLEVQTRFTPALHIQVSLDQPRGIGQLSASVDSLRHGEWTWFVQGYHAIWNGTAFQLPEWSAKGSAQGISVYARAATTHGGMAELGWNQPDAEKESTLEIDVSSVTLRQVMEVFASPLPPHGFDPWMISRGSIEAVIHEGKVLEVKDSDIDIAGMHIDMIGRFDLTKANPQGHVQGEIHNILVAPIVESFFPPDSPLTGTGRAAFTLAFPLSANWIQGLNGTIQAGIDDGVLRALKTIYRVMAVLNLSNYLRLRMPQVTASGILFENISGHLTIQNGVFTSDDLFLRSPNMNIGFKGTVDIPKKRIDSTLRLEMLRFLEDILKYVPITHWIFKKPNKIFLPLIVTLEGPWDSVDVR